MNLITATELRTKTDEFIDNLVLGREISLIKRSKVLGKLKLIREDDPKVFDSKKVMAIAAKLRVKYPVLTPNEIDKRYREAIMKKYGKYLHRR